MVVKNFFAIASIGGLLFLALICVSPITLALGIPADLQKTNGFRIDWRMAGLPLPTVVVSKITL